MSDIVEQSSFGDSPGWQYLQVVDFIGTLRVGILLFDEDMQRMLLNESLRDLLDLHNDHYSLSEFSDMFLAPVEPGVVEESTTPARFLAEAKTGIWEKLSISDAVRVVITKGLQVHFPEVTYRSQFFEVFMTPIRNTEGLVTGGTMIFHDITHLMEVDKMKTDFLSIASHQLRTPLTAIRLFLEMLVNPEVGSLNPTQKEYVDYLQESTQRVIQLVNDFLNVSRLESGKIRIDPEMVQLEELIEGIIKEIEPLAHEKGFHIEFEHPEEPIIKIALDHSLIRQVLHNLVTNAVRYSSGEVKTIKVRLALRESNADQTRKLAFLAVRYVEVAVINKGIGISDQAGRRLFEKFYRAENAIKAQSEGSGLGLYIAKMIIDAAGGKIWFESPPGEETTFFVAIPLVGMQKRDGDRGLAK